MRNLKKINCSDMDFQLLELIQLGAKITVISTKTCYIKFTIKDDFEVVYVYTATKNGKYFLTRIKPYSLPMDEIDNEYQLVGIIVQDIRQFTNAINSSNINTFVDLNSKNLKNTKLLENLFLYYNVDKEVLNNISEKLDDIEEIIMKAKDNSEKILTK